MSGDETTQQRKNPRISWGYLRHFLSTVRYSNQLSYAPKVLNHFNLQRFLNPLYHPLQPIVQPLQLRQWSGRRNHPGRDHSNSCSEEQLP